MNKNIPDSLIDGFRNNQIIPFVGAGVSMSVQSCDGKGIFPSWKRLLKMASDEVRNENGSDIANLIDSFVNLNYYKDAADYARKGLTGSLWNNFFKKHFDVDVETINDESLNLARSIWRLGNRIVTTNYDEVMGLACKDKNFLAIDCSQKAELRDFHSASQKKSRVFHLHGHVGNTSSIIFTTESYERIYKAEDIDYRASVAALKDIFRYRQVVFIGYSLDDIDILTTITEQHELFNENTGPHYILVRTEDVPEVSRKIAGLPIVIISFENFGLPLINLIDKICETGESPKRISEIKITTDEIYLASVQKQCSDHNSQEIERIAKRKYIRELYINRDIESTLKKLLINDESLYNKLVSIMETPYTLLKEAKDELRSLNNNSESLTVKISKSEKASKIKTYNSIIKISEEIDNKLKGILSSTSPCSGHNRKVFQEIERLFVSINKDSSRKARELIENALKIISSASKFITVIVDRAGGGKTNLLCHISTENNKVEPTIFLGGRVAIVSEDSLVIELAKSLGASESCNPFDYLADINNELEKSKVHATIFIDGINENRDISKLNLALNKLCVSLQSSRFRFVFSCRDIYWGFFKESEWVNSSKVIGGNLYSFNKREQPLAIEAYLRFFNIEVNLGKLALERCSHPLLLRFFCEAYSDSSFKKINLGNVDDIRLKPLFDDYWKAKIGGISSNGEQQTKTNIEFVVYGIIRHMLSENSTSLTTDLVSEATGVNDLDSEESLYLGLLDEDIIIEEDPTNDIDIRKVVFVYEEFMEYVAARYLQESLEESSTTIFERFSFFNEKKEHFVNALGITEYYCAFLLERKEYSIVFNLIIHMAREGEGWLPIVTNIFSKYETSLHMIISLSTNEIVSTFDIINSKKEDIDLKGVSTILNAIGAQSRLLMCEVSEILLFSSLLPNVFNLHNVIEIEMPNSFSKKNSASSDECIKRAGEVIKMIAKLIVAYDLGGSRKSYWSDWAGSRKYVGLRDRSDLLKAMPKLLLGSQRRSLVLAMACNGLFDIETDVRRTCALITKDLKNDFSTQIRERCRKSESDLEVISLLKDNIL